MHSTQSTTTYYHSLPRTTTTTDTTITTDTYYLILLYMDRKPKKEITEKQKTARLANLERGRKKRMETLKQKKEKTNEPQQVEYDIGSEASDQSSSDSDSSAFIISKKKPVKKPSKRAKQDKGGDSFNLTKNDVDELKSMMYELASQQKKQNKRSKAKQNEGAGSTKIVLLPQQNQAPAKSEPVHDVFVSKAMEAMIKSLGV